MDLLTIGRSGVDLYPQQTGTKLEDVTSFARFLGGSATNVAVAAARLGHTAGVITRTGDDPFGVYVRRAIAGFGVDTAQVAVSARTDLLTPVTFCEIFPPDHFPIYFYRKPTAPDLQIRADELDLDAVAGARIYWSTVTGLSEEPSRGAHHAAWAARAGRGLDGGRTVLDLDYRPQFWPEGPAAAHAQIQAALPLVDTVIGNLEECTVAVDGTAEVTKTADQLADDLLAAGVTLAIVKQGPRGVLGATPERRVMVEPVPVDVVNGLGAGDAFGGAFCHGLLSGADLETTLRLANAAGSFVAARLACADAMPTLPELLAHAGMDS